MSPVRPFGVLWESRFNGGGAEWLFGVIATTNGYLVAGTTSVPMFGGATQKPWIAQTTTSGDVIWRKEPSPPIDGIYSSIALASDGSVYFSTGGLRILKLNGDGEILWERNYGGGFQTQVIGDRQGGCVAATVADRGGGRDIHVVSLDSAGKLRWESFYGGSSEELAPLLALAPDEGVFLGVSSYSPASGDKTTEDNGGFDGWVLRLDRLGAIKWQRGLGGVWDDFPYAIQASASGDLWVGLGSRSGPGGNKASESHGDEDWWIVRMNAQGERIWETSLGGSGQDRPNSIALADDGGALVAGFSSSVPSGNKYSRAHGSSDIWVVKINSSGTSVWQQTYGSSSFENVNSVLRAGDGGYTVAGVRERDVWMFRLAPENTPSPTEGIGLWELNEYAPLRILSIAGPQGTRYSLEVSSDLQKWNRIALDSFAAFDTKLNLGPLFSTNEFYRIQVD